MVIRSFDALIVNGQLIPADALKVFEGQQVHVTVAAPVSKPPIVEPAPLIDGEPPPDFDVEKDVYVRMPFQKKDLANPVVVKGTGLKPCLILPEELPDE